MDLRDRNFPRNGPATYFRDVMDHARSAFLGSPAPVVWRLTVGSVRVDICFSDGELASVMTKAISHITECRRESTVLDEMLLFLADPGMDQSVSAMDPFYRLFVWDSSSSGVEMPPPPYKIHETHYQGELKQLHDQRHSGSYSASSNILTLADHHRRMGLIAVGDGGRLDLTDTASPFRMVLTWILSRCSHPLIHAAAVGDRNGAVLMGGRSGSGKSSTALQCLSAGLGYFGDDLCAVSVTSGKPFVHSVYATAKCHDEDVPHYPMLAAMLDAHSNGVERKRVYFLNPKVMDGDGLMSSLPIRALLLPTHESNRFGLEPASMAMAIHAFTSEANARFDAAREASLAAMADIVRMVPVWRFHLGLDRSMIPIVIGDILRGDAVRWHLHSKDSA